MRWSLRGADAQKRGGDRDSPPPLATRGVDRGSQPFPSAILLDVHATCPTCSDTTQKIQNFKFPRSFGWILNHFPIRKSPNQNRLPLTVFLFSSTENGFFRKHLHSFSLPRVAPTIAVPRRSSSSHRPRSMPSRASECHLLHHLADSLPSPLMPEPARFGAARHAPMTSPNRAHRAWPPQHTPFATVRLPCHRDAAIPPPCLRMAPFPPHCPPRCHAPCAPRPATTATAFASYKSHPILSHKHC